MPYGDGVYKRFAKPVAEVREEPIPPDPVISIPDVIEYEVRLKNAGPASAGVRVLATRLDADAHWVTFLVDIKEEVAGKIVRRNVVTAKFAANTVASVRAQ